jgi:hypothetical protein
MRVRLPTHLENQASRDFHGIFHKHFKNNPSKVGIILVPVKHMHKGSTCMGDGCKIFKIERVA